MDLRSLAVHASVRTGHAVMRLRKLEAYIECDGSDISGHSANPSGRDVVFRSAGELFVHSVETNCSRPDVHRCTGGGKIVSGGPT